MTAGLPSGVDWLLARFDLPGGDEAFAGDLIEEYRGGRSRRWVWRQALAMVLIAVLAEVKAHPWLALRAIATGMMVAIPMRILREQLGIDGRMSFWIWQMAALALAGLVVARTHRQHGNALTLVFVAYFVFARAWLITTHGWHFWSSAPWWEIAMDLGLTGLCVVCCLWAGLTSGGGEYRFPEHRGRR